MRLLTLAIAIFGMALSVFAWSNADSCAQKAGTQYYLAIKKFCSKSDIVIPSTYAHNGAIHGNAKVVITGNCNPPQWLPSYWCEQQFFQLCASAGVRMRDNAVKGFGKNGCQKFRGMTAQNMPFKREEIVGGAGGEDVGFEIEDQQEVEVK